jgi:hemerythrin-like domain-containing protein
LDTSGPDGGGHAPVDVRDMLVVHTALLREFRLAPAAVIRVPTGARSRSATVDRHLGLLCDLLHHHHVGEDELLWPVLRSRLPAQAMAHLDEAEAQHAGLDQALNRVRTARRTWVERVDDESRDALVATLQTLHRLLAEHLDAEERTLLPLAAAHLTEFEWAAVGEAGAAAIPKSKMPLVFGMFAYEGDPAVLAGMLSAAPALPRMVLPRIAPLAYARRAAQVHGTPRP